MENVYGNTLMSIEKLSEVKKLSTCVNNELSQIMGSPHNGVVNNVNIRSRDLDRFAIANLAYRSFLARFFDASRTRAMG